MQFRRVDVVRRVAPGEVVVYRCFELLPAGGYVVQSADRVRLPIPATHIEDLTKQYWELLCEIDPDARGIVRPTLEAAIEAFDEDFAE